MNLSDGLSWGDSGSAGSRDASVEDPAEEEAQIQRSRKLKRGAVVPLAVLTAGAAGFFLYRNPALREACQSVAMDTGVHEVCRSALDMIRHEVAAAWVRHDGPAALASVFLE